LVLAHILFSNADQIVPSLTQGEWFMRAYFVGAAALALTVASAAPAAAQTEIGLETGLFSSYVWRGISYVNKPVLQPDLSLSFPLGAASLTVGAWGNIELGSYDDPEDDLSIGGGTSLNLSEVDPYAEIGFSAGKAELAIGGVAYVFPNDAGFTSDINTVEVYGTIGLDAPLSPSLGVYYDVDKIKGLYIEGSLSHDIPLGPKALTLGALAGWNISQGPNDDDPEEGVNFADKGITHVDLSASIEFGAGPFTLTPQIHGVFGIDDATRITKPTETDAGFKLWGGISIGWGKSFGGKAEE
jgi:hypothetical protein